MSYSVDKYWKDWKFPGIYIIIHAPSGKKYVGQSVNVGKRVNDHMCCYSKSSKHLSNAMRLYGREEFEAIVAERVDDTSKLTEREQWWIDTLGSASCDMGYNIATAIGSPFGTKHTEETKSRISRAKMGHAPTSGFSGHVHSAETRSQMSSKLKVIRGDQGARIKHSAMLNDYYSNPEYRAKHKAAHSTPEYLAKQSDLKKAYFNNPEARAKQSEASKLGWAKRKAAKLLADTPETPIAVPN